MTIIVILTNTIDQSYVPRPFLLLSSCSYKFSLINSTISLFNVPNSLFSAALPMARIHYYEKSPIYQEVYSRTGNFFSENGVWIGAWYLPDSSSFLIMKKKNSESSTSSPPHPSCASFDSIAAIMI